MNYYYTVDGEHGGLKLKVLKEGFNRVEIVEDSQKTPKLITYKAVYADPEVRERFQKESSNLLKNKYVFIVPEEQSQTLGTI